MSAADYNKADATAFGRAVGNLIAAVRGDGVGAARFTELIGVVTTAGGAVNEMRDVPEAAAEHILGATADTMGDDALARAIEAEAAGQ
jgi:hypothetical protein